MLPQLQTIWKADPVDQRGGSSWNLQKSIMHLSRQYSTAF